MSLFTARRESYSAGDKSQTGTRVAALGGTSTTTQTPPRPVESLAGSAPRSAKAALVTPAPRALARASSTSGLTSSAKRGGGVRKLSYYEGFLGDLLTPEDRGTAAIPPAMSGNRFEATLSRSRAGSTHRSVSGNPSPSGGGDEWEKSLDTSRNGRIPSSGQRSSALRRHTGASVVDPLSNRGVDTFDARPQRSAFDAQLAAAMVNTAHRMCVAAEAASPTTRLSSSSRSRRASQLSASKLGGRPSTLGSCGSRMGSTSFTPATTLPAVGSSFLRAADDSAYGSRHTSGLVDASSTLAALDGDVTATRRIAFSPLDANNINNTNARVDARKGSATPTPNSNAAAAIEAVGWGTQRSGAEEMPSARPRLTPPSAQRPSSGRGSYVGISATHGDALGPNVSSGFALSAEPLELGASRLRSTVTGLPVDAPTQWTVSAPPPPETAPQLSHKQLTEAFYGCYKGGVMANDAYLYFLALQAEEKQKHRRATQRKDERRAVTRVPARRPTAEQSNSPLTPWMGGGEEISDLARDPSAAFDVIGMPPSLSGALQTRLRSMSLQSNQPFSSTWPPPADSVRDSAVRARAGRPFASTHASANADSHSVEGHRREGRGYHQFLCVQDPATVDEVCTTSVDDGLHSVKQQQEAAQTNSHEPSRNHGGPTPSAHLQELLRKSQAVYGDRQRTS